MKLRKQLIKSNLNLQSMKTIKLGHQLQKGLKFFAITLLCGFCFIQGAVANTETPQDKMISIGDHALHTISLGEGEFTVIFESGFGSDLTHWRKVAPAISKQAKVVVYSRAGYGKSDTVTRARTLIETSNELSELITAAALKPPFILVGHSYGGHIIRTYAAQHPSTVAGLVFVDPANEALMIELKKIDKAKTDAFLDSYQKFIPGKLRAEYQLISEIDETGTLPDFGPLPDVPAAVITSMMQEYPEFYIHSAVGKKIWRELHHNLFNQFSEAQHITTINSGHNIALHEPELVIETIKKVLKQASKISQHKRIYDAMAQAIQLIVQNDLKAAHTLVFNALKNSSLDGAKINTLGYQYLSDKTNQNKELASLIFKYNAEHFATNANAFDSYGESLLALNKPEQAKQQFLTALKLIEINNHNDKQIAGIKTNLAKAELAIATHNK